MQALQRKAAQVIFPRLGSNMPPPVRVSEDFERFKALHEVYQFGGLVLFNGHKTDTPATLTALQEISEIPLLVASDIERGAGQQIEGTTRFPHAMACCKAGPDAVATFGRITAQEALASGIHIAFTPVADVNSNPQNPIIGIRAFSDQVSETKESVQTFIQACREVGLLATAKHFPGHGDTATDSHKEVPVVERSLKALASVEFAPFTAAIDAGADLIMTAHVSYPALDTHGAVATLSPAILTDLLKQQLGFQGAVISDSLIMQAIQPADGEMTQFAANLLNAGLDILLDPIDPVAMVHGVAEAVQKGLVPESRLDEAIQKVQQLRDKITGRFGPAIFKNPAQTQQAGVVGSIKHKKDAQEIAQKAIRVHKGSPLFFADNNAPDKQLAIFVTPYRTRLDPKETPVGQALKLKYPDLPYTEVDAHTSSAELEDLVGMAKQRAAVLIIVVSKPAAWHNYGLPDELHHFVTRLTEATSTTLVSLGDPHILDKYPSSTNTICTYSDVPVSQEALVEALSTASG